MNGNKYLDKYTGREIEFGEGFITKGQLEEALRTNRVQGGSGVQKDVEFKLPEEPRLNFQDKLDYSWLIFGIGIIILFVVISGFMFF